MDLSGINFRSVAESNSFSFSSSFWLENVTGVGEFSLSGARIGSDEHDKIKFNFTSGKVYDDDDHYVHSYLESAAIEISGDVSPTKYSYYINKNPFALGKSKSDFKVQRFCFNSTGLNFANVTTEIRGTAPDYYLTFPDTFVSSGYHTGYLVNNSSSLGFRLLGVDVINNFDPFWSVSSFDKNIPANDSGKIVIQDLSGSPVYSSGFYDLRLHTDFGPIKTGISGMSSPSEPRNVDFRVDKIFSGISKTGTSAAFTQADVKQNVYLINYSAYSGITPSGDRKLRVSLQYEEGTTGNFFNGPAGTVLASGDPYIAEERDDGGVPFRRGFLKKSTTGIITGTSYIEGSGYAGVFDTNSFLKSEGHTGNFLSGYSDAKLVTFVYATGTTPSSIMTGATGISPYAGGQTFPATGSGILTEYYNGTWNYTPGAYVATTGELTGNFTGKLSASDLGKKYYSQHVTGNIDAITSGNTSSYQWGAFLSNASVKSTDAAHAASGITGTTAHSGLWTGDIIASGNTTYYGTGTLTGYLTGYEKSFTGSFDIATGLSGEFSFYDSGIEAGSYIWGPHGNIGVGGDDAGVYTGYKTDDNFILDGTGEGSETVYVNFTCPYDYEPITALLTISGIDGNIYTDTITGVR